MIRASDQKKFGSLLKMMHGKNVHHLVISGEGNNLDVYASPVSERFLFRWSGGRPVRELRGRGSDIQDFPASEPVAASWSSPDLLMIMREDQPYMIELFAACFVPDVLRLQPPESAWPGPGDDPGMLWSARFGVRTPLLIHRVSIDFSPLACEFSPRVAAPSLEELQQQGELKWFPAGVATVTPDRIVVYWRCEGLSPDLVLEEA